MNTLTKLRPFVVGMNRYQDMMSLLDNLPRANSKYPPHNLIETDDGAKLEMALAGFDIEDIKIELSEQILTISSNKKDDDDDYEFKGISNRAFTKSFKVSENFNVESAKMNNGLLAVKFVKQMPKVVKIEINK